MLPPLHGLNAVLCAGCRARKAVASPTGTLFTRPMDTTCPICFDPLFGCAGAAEMPAESVPDDDAVDEDDWARCLPAEWAMRKDGPDVQNVLSLRCGHTFHVGCIRSYVLSSRNQGVRPVCPVCRSTSGISREVLEDLGIEWGSTMYSMHTQRNPVATPRIEALERQPTTGARGASTGATGASTGARGAAAG